MMLKKKGALELSINAIVIVILAMTLLGLGLGFVRNMFKDIGKTTEDVQAQMREQILDDLRRGDKKLSFPSQRIDIEKGDEQIIAIGIKNTDPSELTFVIELSEVIGTQTFGLSSDQSLDTGVVYSGLGAPLDGTNLNYAFFWDTTSQKLDAGESNVYGITLKASNNAQGTKLFKINVKNTGAAPNVEFTSKTFFVKFI